jgi:tRNA pseudouridine38-40 synthase
LILVDAVEPSPVEGASRAIRRVALGVSYRGTAYQGWQSQRDGRTVQDALEHALAAFCAQPVSVVCAGRTDTGVHGINQVVHLDTSLDRGPASWVRGTNASLPADIAVQWAMEVPSSFHARKSARGRRYTYVLLQSAVRPSLEAGLVGWVFKPLDHQAMVKAAHYLIGELDFSSFRSSQCQSPTPIKHLREIRITPCTVPSRPVSSTSPDANGADRLPTQQSLQAAAWQGQGVYWRFDFEGKAFLHHMIRNIMGCLLAVGTGKYPPDWVQTVLEARKREVAAPTFPPDGLFFVGPSYEDAWQIPNITPAMGWLPDFPPHI